MRCWSYFFLIAAMAAQTQTGEVTSHDEALTFQSSVNMVRVPVVVRDKAGHTVGGLQKSDFRLTDLGKPQEIAQFSLEGSAAAKPGERQTKPEIQGEPPADARPVAPTRFVAFVFDDVHLTTDELANVRVAALKHVEQGLPPQERVGILTLSGNVSLELTNDVAKFRETLAKIRAVALLEPETELQGFRLGPLELLAGPFETFQALKNDTVAAAVAPLPLVLAMTNDWRGYAPDRSVAARGGYAADFVPIMLGTTPFQDIHGELVAGFLELDKALNA